MKIVIDETVKADLSNNEYKYLLLLEFHSGFIKGVKDIRNKLNIFVAENGETVIKDKFPDGKKLNKMTSQLILKLNIPITLLSCVESFIEWGTVLAATKPILVLNPECQLNRKALYNKKIMPRQANRLTDSKLRELINSSWYEHNQYLVTKYGDSAFTPVIQINKPLTKPEFICAVKREWDQQIAPAIEDFKKSTPFPIEIAKVPVNEVEEYIELLRLRRDGKKHKEIAALLHIEEENVRRKFSNISVFLQKIGFPSLNL